MKSRLLKLIYYAVALCALLIMLLVFLLTVLRVQEPILANKKPAIEAYLSQKFQHPVQIQSLSLKWAGIMPVLNIADLEIFTPDHRQKLFAIHELSVGARLFPSLWHRELLLKYLFINGLQLSFVHDSQGKWQIVGLSSLMPHQNTAFSAVRKSIKIEGKNLSLNIIGTFPQPLLIQAFKTRLIMEKTSAGLQIVLKKLEAENQDAALKGDVNYAEDHIHLKLNYQLFPHIASQVENYLPQRLLTPALIQWLKQSVKSIKESTGVFVLEGKLADFPYTARPGQFLVDTTLKGVTLAYDKDWPAVENMEGNLVFHNDSMQMIVTSAKTGGMLLKHLEASIPELGGKSVLKVAGNVFTQTQDLMHFVAQSPLKKTVGKYVKGYTWAGPAELYLKLAIPLTAESKSPLQATGILQLKENSLHVSSDTSLEKLKAEIHFTQAGITGKSLNAMLWKTPLAVEIGSRQYRAHYGKWQLTATERGERGWQVDVLHPQLAGFFILPSGLPPAAVRGRFRYMTAGEESSSPSSKITFSPAKVPALNILIDDFRYRDKHFGRVNMKTSPLSNGLKLENLQAVLGKTILTLTGYWVNQGQQDISSISGKLTSQDVAEMLKNWGFSPSITSRMLAGNYQFQWPSTIYSPDVKTLQGNVHFEIGKGEILNISSQAKMNIGHLLTLLSFQSVGRRLKLDFSDLTAKGLNFDSLKGDFQFNTGQASTRNTLLEGPVAEILMTGTIDMVNQTYQLKLVVTPHLTSSLPIIAAIAGGPVIGAAAWAADKLFNPLVSKITSDTYTITGPWDKPVIR